jgi:hypothetical protein
VTADIQSDHVPVRRRRVWIGAGSSGPGDVEISVGDQSNSEGLRQLGPPHPIERCAFRGGRRTGLTVQGGGKRRAARGRAVRSPVCWQAENATRFE